MQQNLSTQLTTSSISEINSAKTTQVSNIQDWMAFVCNSISELLTQFQSNFKTIRGSFEMFTCACMHRREGMHRLDSSADWPSIGTPSFLGGGSFKTLTDSKQPCVKQPCLRPAFCKPGVWRKLFSGSVSLSSNAPLYGEGLGAHSPFVLTSLCYYYSIACLLSCPSQLVWALLLAPPATSVNIPS